MLTVQGMCRLQHQATDDGDDDDADIQTKHVDSDTSTLNSSAHRHIYTIHTVTIYSSLFNVR